MARYNDKNKCLQYGASVYRKRHSDDRIDNYLIEKHYETAIERLIKCPVNIPFNEFIEINSSFDMNDEDILFSLAQLILYDSNGKKRVKVKGERLVTV